MLRDLIKEGGLYTIANLLTKGVSLLLIPFYSDYFTQAEYGILAMLGIAGGFSAAFFSFQIYQGVGRFITEKGLTHRQQQEIGSSGFWFNFISYAIFILLAFVFKDQVLNLLSEDEKIQDSTYYWCLFAVALNGVFNALSVQLKFLRMTKAFSITTFLHAILNIGFILLFALGFNYRIDSVYMATIVVTPALILFQVYYLRKYLIFYIGKLEVKKLLRFSVPLIPAAIAYLVLGFTDRIFIKEMSGSLAEVGIYDMAFKFSAIISLIIVSFQSALAPIIYEQHQDKGAQDNLGRILRLFVGTGTLGGLCLAFFSYETLYVFTQPEYYEASVLMPIFYLSVLITGLGMFSPGLHLKNKTKYIPIIVIITAVINVILNFWLIPIYSLMGAAIATFISTLINNLALFILAQKLYPIPFTKTKMAFVLFIFAIVFVAGSYFTSFIELEYIYQLGIKIGIIVFYAWFLLRVNFISFDQIKDRLIRNKK
ncbi:MAG: O-antigen/teichoic acid export membrane protein [Crocinitomix sp.]|jgi:O-antigen/teichoic acid export membrane protein